MRQMTVYLRKFDLNMIEHVIWWNLLFGKLSEEYNFERYRGVYSNSCWLDKGYNYPSKFRRDSKETHMFDVSQGNVATSSFDYH